MKKVNTMIKEFSRKYAVLFALLVSVLYISFLLGIGKVLAVIAGKVNIKNYGYALMLIQEIIGTVAALIILKLTGFFDILKSKGTGVFKGLITGGYFIFAGLISIPAQLYIYTGDRTFRSPLSIAVFVLCMVFVGASEEIVFRGVITTTLYKKFAGTNSGIWKAVVISGLFFGLVHFINMVSVINSVGVLIQVAVASVMGMVLSALYLRNGTIWVNIVLHAFIDIAAGITSIYAGQTVLSTIGGYEAIQLLGIIPYTIVLLVLLRKKKIETIPANFAQLFAEPAENASFVEASPVDG
ncbi:MAG: CPBP family intramembrane metalloprotease [Spirochaetaceae bacterium]|nr:CPBP family intramembrane metalloprotease [Spirochaetaceae bacterium]